MTRQYKENDCQKQILSIEAKGKTGDNGLTRETSADARKGKQKRIEECKKGECMMKKIISSILVTTMTVSMLAGCGGQKTESAPETTTAAATEASSAAPETKTDAVSQAADSGSGGITLPVTQETITYTYMAPENPSSPVTDEFVVIPEIEKRTNLKFDMTWVPESNYSDKLSVVLSSGEIPDYIGNVSVSVANNYGPKGLFLNIWDYIDYMPNMQRLFKEDPKLEAYKYSDTELYTLPVQYARDIDPQGFGYFKQIPMIRTDIMKELGLENPETFEELHDCLAAMKKAYPDSYPWVHVSGIDPLITQMLVGWSGKVFSYSNYYTTYDENTKKYTFALEEDGFKEMIAYLTDMYKEGLLDPEFLSTDTSQWEERLLNGKGFFTYANWNKSQNLTTKGRAAGNDQFEIFGIKPPVENGKPGVVVRPLCSGTNALSAKVEHPEILLQALDYWLYSRDGAMLANAGIEGVNYEWAEPDKVYRLIDPTIEKPDNETHKKHFGVRYGWMTGVRPDSFGIHNYVDPEDMMFRQHEIYAGLGVDAHPIKIFRDKDDFSTLKQIGIPVRDYIDQQLAKIICGYESIDTWDSMVDTCKKMGSDTVVEILNK